MLDDRTRERLAGLDTGRTPSAQTTLITIVPTLWAGIQRGRPANICVAGCRILQHCYAQLGIRSEIRAVHLAITDGAGRTFMHGSLRPSWERNVLDGHCILYLPDEQRVVDATVEQFREVSRLRMGPLVGMMAFPLAGGAGGSLPAGSQLPIRRADLTLLYTMADDDATRVVLGHRAAREHPDVHWRAGADLASATVDFLRRYLPDGQLDMSPYPRAAALLAAVGDLPADIDESGNWYFSARDDSGETQRLRLDDLTLPPGVPPPATASAPRDKRDESSARRPGSRLNAADLEQGLPVGGGILLRMARPGDAGEAGRLLAMAGPGLPQYLEEAVEGQVIGSTLMRALESSDREILTALATAAHDGDPNLAMPGLTALLLAESAGHRVCGALLALPPAAIMANAANAGADVKKALLGNAMIVKVNGIAVDEDSRRQSIGTALLALCVQLYFQLDYHLAYGQVRADSGLEGYYRRRGFDVLAPGEGISLNERLTLPIGLTPESGQQFFLRWR